MIKGIYNRTLYGLGKWILAAVFAAAIVIWVYGERVLEWIPGCTFERLTGLYCPGCGGSRAVIAFFDGHFIRSFLYHPLVPYSIVVLTVFMIRMFLVKHAGLKEGKDGRINIFIYIGIGILILQWIVKLILLVCFEVSMI
ncbi:MAG: DUF2752 domain-containing protein [Lachnospiraceae bacterium]|nr:DUF2752 domain-containing protein [Lachnospiraceae bacterium]